MEYSSLLVVRRVSHAGEMIRRYALCPDHSVTPGDLVTLHGDPEIYEASHTFADPMGELQEVATAMNPVFYINMHWIAGKEYSLIKGEGGEVIHEPV